MRFVERDLCGLVCVDEPATDGEEERILGYVWWKRVVVPSGNAASAAESNAKGEDAEPWSYNDNNTSMFAAVERRLIDLEARYDTFFRLNGAVDYARRQQWGAWAAEDDCLAPLKGVTHHWWLDALAVAPEAQRRGVGSLLVQWGKEEAEKEARARGVAIPIVLIATFDGQWLYKKQGFKVVVWAGRAFTKKLGMVGGQVFIWDPSQTWIRDAPAGTVDASGEPVDAVWTEKALQTAAAGKK